MALTEAVTKPAVKAGLKKAGVAASKSASQKVVAGATHIDRTIHKFYSKGAQNTIEDIVTNPANDSTLVYMKASEFFDFQASAPNPMTAAEREMYGFAVNQGNLNDIVELQAEIVNGKLMPKGSKVLNSSPDRPSLMDYLGHMYNEEGIDMTVPVILRTGDRFDENFVLPAWRAGTESDRPMFRTPLLKNNKTYDVGGTTDDALVSLLRKQPETPEAKQQMWESLHTPETANRVFMAKGEFQYGVHESNHGFAGSWKHSLTTANTGNKVAAWGLETSQKMIQRHAEMDKMIWDKLGKSDPRLKESLRAFTEGSAFRGTLLDKKAAPDQPLFLHRTDTDLTLDPTTGQPASLTSPLEVGMHFGNPDTSQLFALKADRAKQVTQLRDELTNVHNMMDLEGPDWEDFITELESIVANNMSPVTKKGNLISNKFDVNGFVLDFEREYAELLDPSFAEDLPYIAANIARLADQGLVDTVQSVWATNAKNPLMVADIGGFNPSQLADQLSEMEPFATKYASELESIKMHGVGGGQDTPEFTKATKMLHEIVEKEGYDSFGYINPIEPGDGGSMSYILWKPETLKNVYQEQLQHKSVKETFLSSLLFGAMGLGIQGTPKQNNDKEI